jgi:predicted nucleic acid-binding protein
MTRYAIDSITALRLIRDAREMSPAHSLVAPSVLRSHALASLYRSARTGELTERDARALLEDLARQRIRLLADRVSRAVAWKIAAQLDWDDTTLAEYLAVASLQADALIAGDARLTAGAPGIVEVADYEELFR